MSEGNSMGSLVFTVEKQHLRLGDSQHYIFMGATKHLSEQLFGTHRRQAKNCSVWSSPVSLNCTVQ